MAPEDKNVAKRPDAKEGGREEEKTRLGISAGPRGAAGRLRNKKPLSSAEAPDADMSAGPRRKFQRLVEGLVSKMEQRAGQAMKFQKITDESHYD
ncbi:MAG: hypothetical protein V4562_00525 [Pseudomonadota bacterium]